LSIKSQALFKAAEPTVSDGMTLGYVLDRMDGLYRLTVLVDQHVLTRAYSLQREHDKPGRLLGAQGVKVMSMAADTSPDTVSSSGVRRVNNLPIYIVVGIMLVFLLIMMVVAMNRADPQQLRE
jgi:hypothetical protein